MHEHRQALALEQTDTCVLCSTVPVTCCVAQYQSHPVAYQSQRKDGCGGSVRSHSFNVSNASASALPVQLVCTNIKLKLFSNMIVRCHMVVVL